MKKILFAMLVSAIIVSACACSNKNEEIADPTVTSEVTEDALSEEVPSEETEPEEETQPQEITVEQEPSVLPLVDDDDVIFMMDKVLAHQPGTAGASLKLYGSAFAVLNFAQVYTDVMADMVKGAVTEYVSYLSDEQVECMKETVAEIDTVAYGVFENGIDSVKDILNDAGNPQKYDEYSAENYEKVMGIVKEALGI